MDMPPVIITSANNDRESDDDDIKRKSTSHKFLAPKRLRLTSGLDDARLRMFNLRAQCLSMLEIHKNQKRSGLLPALSSTFKWCSNPQPASGRRYRKSSSRELGIRVERELMAYTMKRRVNPEHRVTGWLIDSFSSRGWTLLDSQIPLIDPVSGVFTWIDFIAYDSARGCLVLIELKTGYDNGYSSALIDGKTEGATASMMPLIKRPDSFLVRHALQLCFMDWALRYILKLPREAFYSCVVRATNHRITKVRAPEPLPTWAAKQANDIVALIREKSLCF